MKKLKLQRKVGRQQCCFTQSKIENFYFLIIIFISSFLVFNLTPFCAIAQTAFSASLYFLPATGYFEVDKLISIRFAVNTGDDQINLVEATISFSNNLEVTSISKQDSIIKLWFNEPTFSNAERKIYFSGGIPNPGFKGLGRLLIINFKAKIPGSAWIMISSAQVLANDGFGTNILKSSGQANFTLYETGLPKPTTIKPEPKTAVAQLSIFSSTHPHQEKWYQNKNLILSWTWKAGITDYSFLLDRNLKTVPDNIGEGLNTSVSYSDLEEGVWSFHLKAKTSAGWSETVRFKIQIDNSAPSYLKVFSQDGEITFNPSPTIIFEAKDELSGIDYFAVKINENDFAKVEKDTYQIPKQRPGEHQIIVRAYDRAGNYLEELVITIESIPRPIITYWTKEMLIGETINSLNILGLAPKDSKIKLFLTHENGKTETFETETQREKWRLSVSKLFLPGKYRGYAIAMIGDEESPPSKAIEVKVVKSGLRFWIIPPEMIWGLIVVLICGFGILLTLYLGGRRKFQKCDLFVRKLLAKKDKGVKIKVEEK